MKKWLTIIFSILFVLVVDLTTKHFLFAMNYTTLIPNVVAIYPNGGNTGAAFGIFSGNTFALVLVSVILIIGLFIFNNFVKNKNIFYCLSFGFIIGGALGNLYDRVALGYVRDFIHLEFWKTFPTFNLADSFLCIGVAMLAIYLIFMWEKKSEKSN